MEQKRKPGRPPKDSYGHEETILNSPEGASVPVVVGEQDTVPQENFISEPQQSISTAENLSPENGNISEVPPLTGNQNQPDTDFPEQENLPEGWSDILSAPRNGTPITVSNGTNEANAYWKRTRAFANTTHRWEETGFFAGELSGQKLPFNPTMWKVRERRR